MSLSDRYLCLAFRRLRVDLARRMDGIAPREDEPARRAPLAVVETHGGGVRIVAADEAAQEGGVAAGMTLTEGRVLLPALRAVSLVAGAVERALDRLCAWALRMGPSVGRIAGVEGRPAAVLAEVAGSLHLFGGEEALLGRAVGALARAGYQASAAVASTVGAAYAVAAFAERPGPVPRGEEAQALGPLPPAALRLDPEPVRRLARLGVRDVARLLALPRTSLRRRLGPAPLLRISQALGEVPEPLAAERPAESFRARVNLDEPEERVEAALAALGPLLEDAAAWLAARGEGARRLEVALTGEGPAARPPVTEASGVPCTATEWREVLEVALGSARRDPRRLLRLCGARLRDARLPGRFRALELAVLETGPWRGRQGALLAACEDEEAEALLDLVDRLGARLGEERVLRATLVPEARPERAFRVAPATSASPQDTKIQRVVIPAGRPARLFDPPREGDPAGLREVGGAERIESGWWAGEEEPRDYALFEDPAGRRLWGYRQGGKLRLQGSYG